MKLSECSFPGCDRPRDSKGLCASHHTQQLRGGPLKPLRTPANRVSRFWSRVDKLSSGCWVWLGRIENGYGRFWAGRNVLAHQFAWEVTGKPIPEAGWWHPTRNPNGWVLDHDKPGKGCGRKDCVNPDHLEAVTQPENTQRRRKRSQ